MSAQEVKQLGTGEEEAGGSQLMTVEAVHAAAMALATDIHNRSLEKEMSRGLLRPLRPSHALFKRELLPF